MAETYTSRTLRELLRIVASRFLGMVVILVIIVGAVVAASLYIPKQYRSEVQLMATPSSLTSPLEGTTTSQREQVSLFVTTQREIIRSDYVLASALMRLNGKDRNKTEWDKAGEKPLFSGAQVDEYISKNTEKLRRFKRRVGIVTPGGPDATFTQTFKIRVDWPEIREEGKTREQTRQKAAKDCFELAKYIVHAYLTRYKALEEERTAASSKLLKTAVNKVARKQLDEVTAAMAKYSAKLGPDLVTVVSILGQQGIDSGPAKVVSELETKISDLDGRGAEMNALKQVIDKELAKKDRSKIAVPDEIARSNIAVNILQQKVTTLKLDLNNLLPQYTDRYREVDTRKKELALAYQDLHQELVKQRERTIATIAIVTAEKKEYQRRLDVFTTRMDKLGAQSVEYGGLLNELEAATKNYNEEQERWLESVRAEGLARNPVLVSVLDDPSRPNPSEWRQPIIWLNILIACVAGIVLSLVYAFLADHFDHTIKSVDDAERYLGTPVLSSVPKLGKRIIRTR